MNGLGKRLDALEQIAEEMRLRPIRELAAEHGMTFERLLELYEQCRAETERDTAAGLTDNQIVEATARRLGISVEEMRARADALRERFEMVQ